VNSLLRVLSYLKPFRMLAVVTFVCAGLATALELVPPYLVKIVIDDVIQSKRPEMLPWVLGALLGSYVLRNLMSSMRVRFNNLLEQKAVHALRMQVFGALQRLSLSYFENRSTGEIMTRVTSDTEHVERIFVDGLEGLLTASLTLVGITIMMFVLNWKLALLSLLPIPISDRLCRLVYEAGARVLRRDPKKRGGPQCLSSGCLVGHQRDHRLQSTRL
jgi:ABC-type multidrug transport system fused ATPase/permease subunit